MSVNPLEENNLSVDPYYVKVLTKLRAKLERQTTDHLHDKMKLEKN